MKSLVQIARDNVMTGRDFGGMCRWFVFYEGDLLGCFVEKTDAELFASSYEYDHSVSTTMNEAK